MARSRSSSRTRSRSPTKIRADSPDASADKRAESSQLSPFLIRVFVTKGKHTPLLEFDDGKFPIQDEFAVYGWTTSTPTSIISLLYPAFPPTYRSPQARYSFRHVYVDATPRGLYKSKDLVSFTGRDILRSTAGLGSKSGAGVSMDMELDDGDGDRDRDRGTGGKVDEKTLEEYGYITGDLLSINLFVPEPKPPLAIRNAAANAGAAEGGVKSHGWGRNGHGTGSGRDRDDGPPRDQRGWGRGQPLPPQDGAALGVRGGGPPGGNWRGGAPGGIRGASGHGRRRSITTEDRAGGGWGARSRSRSPERRRR